MSRQSSKACSGESIYYYVTKRMEANDIPNILTEDNIHLRPMSSSIGRTRDVDLCH